MADPPPANLVRAFRQVLVARGLAFCDDADDAEQQHFPPPPSELSQGCQPLLLAGVDASSTDAPSQGIGCTLDDDGHSFWSSTGSQGPDASEFLLYKLRSPLCVLRYVQLVVFRAQYQWGGPVYPPSCISFQTGPSPWNLAPPSLKYPVAATEAVQTFPLPADLPLGRYLRVNLHGKRQQQLEDMQFYLAIQRVEAFGRTLTGGEAALLRSSLACQPRPLPAPGVVPTYVVSELADSERARQAQQAQQEQQAQQAQRQAGERQREGQQQQGDGGGGGPNGSDSSPDRGRAGAGEGGMRWWWPQARSPRRAHSTASDSDLSFAG